MEAHKWRRSAATTSPQPMENQQVEFFYTNAINMCSFGNASTILAPYITVYGGVCAYIPVVDRLYYCPASFSECYTGRDSCRTGAGNAQITCNSDGFEWCCNSLAGETCNDGSSVLQGTLCNSKFSSPLAGVDIQDAEEKYLDFLGYSKVSQITNIFYGAIPTIFSTRELSLFPSSQMSTSVGSGQTLTVTSAYGVTITASPNASTSASSAHDSCGSSLSPGAIVGIMFGITACLALPVLIFHVMKRKRSRAAPPRTSQVAESWPASTTNVYTDDHREPVRHSPRAFYGDQIFRHELGNTIVRRSELPPNSPIRPVKQRHEMGL